MFDYGAVTDAWAFRAHTHAGYLQHLPSAFVSAMEHEPIVFTALVSVLARSADRRASCDRFGISIDGEQADRIDFMVCEGPKVVTLQAWLELHQPVEPLFLNRTFRFVLTDVSESFELNAAEVIEKVLPHYDGFLHSWLDANSVREGFPTADRHGQNYYAHHMLDYFEYGVRSKWPLSALELEARTVLLRSRKHVVRHIAVAKSADESAATPEPIAEPFAFAEPALLKLLEAFMDSAPKPLLHSVGTPFLDALSAKVVFTPPELADALGPRMAQVARLGALEQSLSSFKYLQVPNAGEIAALAEVAEARIAEAKHRSW